MAAGENGSGIVLAQLFLLKPGVNRWEFLYIYLFLSLSLGLIFLADRDKLTAR